MSRKSNERLLKEYPELADVYREVTKIVGASHARLVVDMTVQRGDPTLMYWHGVESGASHYRNGTMPANLQGLSHRSKSEVYMYDDSGRRVYGRGIPVWSVEDFKFLRQRLNSVQHETPLSCLRYIIVVDSEMWSAPYIGSDDSPPGLTFSEYECVEARINITLYKPPQDGWSGLGVRTNIFYNVRLRGGNMLSVPYPDESWYRELVRIVGEQAHKFQGLAWNRGFKDLGEGQGMLGDVSVSVLGDERSHIQLERAGIYFAMMRYPGSSSETGKPILSFIDIDGTLDDVDAMLNDAIVWWLTASEDARQAVFGSH